MRRVVAVAALACAGCSFFAVDRRPPVAEVTTPSDCTDSYTMPLVDVAVVAGLIGYSFYLAHEFEEECDRGGDDCDTAGAFAVAMPYVYAVPFAFSAGWGTRQVHRCRDLREWQTTQPFFPHAGELGHRCIPVEGGPGRCLASSCVDGMCVDCNTPIVALERAADAAERRHLFRAMPIGCRRLLQSTCNALVPATMTGMPYPESCRFLLSSIGAHR
ncbi:MAG TPA: hypothetical protein VMZ28_24180 [Kofleriaceae bacterium]|nr:hypothetical protein [Kofleriaceae bacterium]